MQIIYSIGGCTFAGKGIGETAYHGAYALYQHNFLKKLIIPAFVESEINENVISIVPSNPRGLNRIFGERYGSFLKDKLHDFLAAQKIEKCDIFHGWAGMSLKSGRRAKSLGAKFVLQRASSHILTQKKLLEEEYERWGTKEKPILPQVVERNLAEYEEADYILLPSEFAESSFIEHGVNKGKLLTIPFGTDLGKLKTPVCASRQNSKLNVLYVGQISLRKGIPYLLQAWNELRLKDAELVLVGNVDSGIQKAIKLSSYQAIKLIDFTDPTPYYQSADIFVFPSIEEGSALVTYEALAAGLPVITTFNSGSVVRDNIEGFIVPIRDVNALKEKMLEFYEDKHLRSQMSLAAHKRAEKFSWEKHGECLVDTYKQLVNFKCQNPNDKSSSND